jgi:hypothetical protein
MSAPTCPQCGELGPGPGNELCDSCKSENEESQKLIEGLTDSGHSRHCACRIVWGDGECECKLHIPPPWIDFLREYWFFRHMWQ